MSFGVDAYTVIDEGCRESARAVVPVLVERLNVPRRVTDVGCGHGWWGEAFAELYASDVTGVDGPEAREHCRIAKFRERDLAEEGALRGLELIDQDLAVCLEVAEHLPAKRAPSFIAELCQLAPVIAFSAAIPGQGGINHLNEQWPGYWTELFEQQGFAVSGKLRWEIWDDDRVENWYRQNLLIAATPSMAMLFGDLFRGRCVTPHPVVHPVLFDARRT